MPKPLEPRPRRALVFVGTLDQGRVAGALAVHGFEPVTPVDVDIISSETMAVAVVDPSLAGPDPVPATELLALRMGDTPLIALSGPCSRQHLAGLVSIPTLTAIVARDHVSSDEELRHALRCLVDGPSFGLAGLVDPAAPVFTRELAGSADRDFCLQELAAFAEAQGVRRRIRLLFQDVADELLTNAIYDAPVDAQGNPLYAALDRRQSVELAAGMRPVLTFACDQAHAAIAGRDPHGSLRLATARRYLAKGLAGGPDQLDAKLGGAGLGLTRIYGMVDRMAVQVAPGVRTEVVALVELGGARRDLASRPSSLVLSEARP